MNFRQLQFNIPVFLACLLTLGFSSSIRAQALPEVQVRFANPQFEKSTQTYSLDVEMRSNEAELQLFGMNVRFFYDAEKLTFQELGDFGKGYGILGAKPKALKGDSQSGAQMFKLYESAAYVNTSVQLMNSETPLKMKTNQWTKYFTAYFKVSSSELDKERFSPSLIWDLRYSPKGGGFLQGSAGVLVTVVEKDPATRQESAPANLETIHYNWVQTNTTKRPYGYPVEDNALPLVNQVASNPVLSHGGVHRYELLQNQPNPFIDQTRIEFYLPESVSSAKLTFFDAAGKLIQVIQGDYSAGYNSVVVYRDDFNQAANVLFYRLETPGYVSDLKKMILLRR